MFIPELQEVPKDKKGQDIKGEKEQVWQTIKMRKCPLSYDECSDFDTALTNQKDALRKLNELLKGGGVIGGSLGQ